MKDQVDALRSKGIRAATINPSLTTAQRRTVMREVLEGHWEICMCITRTFHTTFYRVSSKVRP